MSETMVAARFSAPDRSLRLEEVPVPEPGPLEVVVKVEACGICLSDVHLIDGSFPPVRDLVTVGHESSGVVARTGELVKGWEPGDRVSLMGGRPCGECDRCRVGALDQCLSPQLMGFHYDGAWASYVVVPYFTLTAIPDHIPFEQAAILADAVATPYAALVERAQLKAGEAVGLWGIGGLGTHAVQIARLLGAAAVIAVDPLESARQRALDRGADVAVDPGAADLQQQIMDATCGRGLDVALDLVGSNKVLQQAVSCLGRGGRAVIVGISIDPIQLGPSIIFTIGGHALLGHLGYRKAHMDDLVRLVAGGRLDLSTSISDVIPLSQVHEGVRRLAEKDGDPVRILITP